MARANLEPIRAKRLGETLIWLAEQAERGDVLRDAKVVLELEYGRADLVHVGISNGVISLEDWI